MIVTIVTPVYPYPRRGIYTGIERYVEGLCKGFKKENHRVRVVTTFWNGGKPYENADGVEIYRLPDLRMRVGRLSGAFELDFLSFSYSVYKNSYVLDGDVVLLNLPFPFLRLIKRCWPSAGILHHVQPIKRLKDALSVPFGNLYGKLTNPDYYIAHSAYSANEFKRLFKIPGERVAVVPEGVDLERFNPKVDSSPVKARFNNSRIILFVGNLHPSKGVHVLMKIFKLVAETVKDVRLIIVGDGREKARLKDLAASLGIASRVHFEGFVPDEVLPSYYAACDVFASASVLEGYGLIFLEAMATGKPVVAFRTASIPEVVGDAGFLVDPLDIKKFAEAIIKLLTDEPMYEELSTRGLERASMFTWENTARQIIRFLR